MHCVKNVIPLSIFLHLFISTSTNGTKNIDYLPQKVIVKPNDTIIKLMPRHIAVLEDRKGTITYPEVKNRSFQEYGNQFKITRSVYWAKFIILNNSSDTLKRLLMVDYPLAEKINLYTNHSQRSIQTGTTVPLQHQSVSSSDMLLNLELIPGSNDVFLRMKSPVAKFPLILFTPTSYSHEKSAEHMYYALVCGFILLMIALNFYAYFNTRDSVHILYFLYIVLAVFTFLAYTGLAYEYFWPNLPWWNKHSFYLLQNLMIAAHILFAAELLLLDVYQKSINKLLYGAAMIFTINGLLSLFFSSYLSYAIITYLCMLLFPLAFVAGYYPVKFKYKPAYYYMAVCIMFTFSVITSYVRNLITDVEPEGTCRSIAFALTVEIIILSIALGIRVKQRLQNIHPPNNALKSFQTTIIVNNQSIRLSQKEQWVIQCLEEGMTDREIAEALSVSVTTVKTHLRNIYFKLEVRNRREAVLKVKYAEV